MTGPTMGSNWVVRDMVLCGEYPGLPAALRKHLHESKNKRIKERKEGYGKKKKRKRETIE